MSNKQSKLMVLIISGVILALVALLIWFPRKPQETPIILPNVKVLEIETSLNQEEMKFVGFIQPKDIQQATFGSLGTIEKVYVSEGQYVKKGTLLMSINDDNAQLSLTNANESYKVALSNRDQAKALMDAEDLNYKNEKENYEKDLASQRQRVKALQDEYEVAKAKLEQAKTDHGENSPEAISAQWELNEVTTRLEAARLVLTNLEAEEPASIAIAEARYKAAAAAYETATTQTTIAQNGVKAAQEQVNQTKLVAGIDGDVVAILQKVGDLAIPLMPSVIVASQNKVAVFGLSQSTVNNVKKDMPAKVNTESESLIGSISDISALPDETSRTYEARVDIGFNEDLNIGETVEVVVELQETEGVWIDLNILKNDGQDYVYIVQNHRIFKRVVERIAMRNNLVLIKNVQKGDLIVIEGFNNVKVGDQVNIIED